MARPPREGARWADDLSYNSAQQPSMSPSINYGDSYYYDVPAFPNIGDDFYHRRSNIVTKLNQSEFTAQHALFMVMHCLRKDFMPLKLRGGARQKALQYAAIEEITELNRYEFPLLALPKVSLFRRIVSGGKNQFLSDARHAVQLAARRFPEGYFLIREWPEMVERNNKIVDEFLSNYSNARAQHMPRSELFWYIDKTIRIANALPKPEGEQYLARRFDYLKEEPR